MLKLLHTATCRRSKSALAIRNPPGDRPGSASCNHKSSFFLTWMHDRHRFLRQPSRAISLPSHHETRAKRHHIAVDSVTDSDSFRKTPTRIEQQRDGAFRVPALQHSVQKRAGSRRYTAERSLALTSQVLSLISPQQPNILIVLTYSGHRTHSDEHERRLRKVIMVL